ncbi:hypothetical protein ACFL09_02630 [Planctomycetota bacterium]
MARPTPLLWTLLLLAALATPAVAGAPRLRVGTFRRTEVLVAYYRSAAWNKVLADKRAERDKAKAAGDKDKVAKLEAWGAESQHRAHRQLAGQATLDANGLLDHLKTVLPAVAAQAKVALIVEQPLFKDDSVEDIDVTAPIAKLLAPRPTPPSTGAASGERPPNRRD